MLKNPPLSIGAAITTNASIPISASVRGIALKLPGIKHNAAIIVLALLEQPTFNDGRKERMRLDDVHVLILENRERSSRDRMRNRNAKFLDLPGLHSILECRQQSGGFAHRHAH